MSKFFRLNRGKQVILLLAFMLMSQNGSVAFAKDHHLFSWVSGYRDLYIKSPDKSTLLAHTAGSRATIKVEFVNGPIRDGLGYSWTSHWESYHQIYGQYLGANGGERKFSNTLGTTTLGYSVDVYYYLWSSFRMFWSGKLNFDFDLSSTKIILTDDPNRSASCSSAIDASYADPNVSVEPILTNCPSIRMPFMNLSVEQESGLDWYISDHWVISFRKNYPSDYNVQKYVIQREPRTRFLVGYNF